MKKIFLLPALALSLFLTQGCDKNDDLATPGGNKEVENTFKTMYSDATRVEWEKKSEYWIADFWQNNKEMEAWFYPSGIWYRTETDIHFEELPEVVRTTFSTSEYQTWHVEDVDKFDHKDQGVFYVLDVEKGEREYDLYYSPDGTIIKAVPDK